MGTTLADKVRSFSGKAAAAFLGVCLIGCSTGKVTTESYRNNAFLKDMLARSLIRSVAYQDSLSIAKRRVNLLLTESGKPAMMADKLEEREEEDDILKMQEFYREKSNEYIDSAATMRAKIQLYRRMLNRYNEMSKSILEELIPEENRTENPESQSSDVPEKENTKYFTYGI